MALVLGVGTMIGYQRIVVTVAEKIGKAHLTYAQGAAAVVAAVTIGLADVLHMPVSTTHVLSSGVAGTMWANRSGIQGETVRKIGLAWVFTLPAATVLSAALFSIGGFLIPDAGPRSMPGTQTTETPTIATASQVSHRDRIPDRPAATDSEARGGRDAENLPAEPARSTPQGIRPGRPPTGTAPTPDRS